MVRFLAVITVCLVLSEIAAAQIELVARGNFSGEDHDLSGLTEELEPGVAHDRLGGMSALEYSGSGTTYYALPDRGPSDGAVPYHCRVQVLQIELPQPATASRKVVGELMVSLQESRLLTNPEGQPLIGWAAAFAAEQPAGARRFDPEGLRLGSAGKFYISDEYGPWLLEFQPDGRQTKSLPVPAIFHIAHPSGSKEEEASQNVSGRQPNGGMEGLGITPGGDKLFGLMQRPLIQDSAAKSDGKRSGVNVRLLEVDLSDGKTREFVYQLDDEKNGNSEILSVNDHEFLVIERDGEKGKKARFKKIMHVDLANATDVSDQEALPPGRLPANITPVKKHVLIDLLDPQFGLAGDTMPEKVEGLTFGPTWPGGQRLLMVGVDNDFIAAQPSWIYAFSIDAKKLPGFGWPY